MITIGGYTVDAALSEDHNFDCEVTSFPVERGANITDHIRQLPKSVTIEGIVSDTPIGRAGVVRSGVAALQEEGLIEAVPFSSEALDTLLAIQAKGEPVTITTSLKVYENMALEKLSVPRDASTGAALRFTATFTEIRIVENRRTRVRTATPAGQRKSRSGNKPAKPTTKTPNTTTYWCLEDRAVFIKPEHLADARAMQSASDGRVWTDWKNYPTVEYTQRLLICTRKRPVNRNSDGTLTTPDVRGNPRALTVDEAVAMNRDGRDRASIAGLDDPVGDPIDSRTGHPLSWTDRETKKAVRDALTKPAWQRKAEELLDDDFTSDTARDSDFRDIVPGLF